MCDGNSIRQSPKGTKLCTGEIWRASSLACGWRVVTLQGSASQVIPAALGAVRRLVSPQPSVYGPMNNAGGRNVESVSLLTP
ncbi:hypothetical protein RRG08_038078 [Elysia crispata]|uniref:Uncharacterized protein n=1 Tax=Elysia crispata TaxID=231223 RepID=A0AAE0ZYC1_9GAST|nr:hypothetical protein RRG08_038078 [Elysia crispata]